MPRSNRPRGRRADTGAGAELDLSKVLQGRRRIENKRDGAWNVQPLPASGAMKTYSCPGCGLDIAEGMQHVVAWRADGIMGEVDDLAARRHWHTHCWKVHT